MAKVSRKQRQADTPQNKELIYKAGLYHRLSDEDMRAVEDNSIGNQHKICLDYAESQGNIEVVDTYIDNGFSGGSFNRPGFQRLLRDINNGRVNCIIVKDLSRFGRNFIETSEYLEKIFPLGGIRFVAVNNGYDNISEMSEKEGIVIPFSNMMNEMYLRDTSRKIRSSINTLIDKGEYMPSASSIPYGYLRDGENGTYKVDAEAAEVVHTIFLRKLEGYSNCAIAASLNEQDIPSPGRLRYQRGMSRDKRNETALWSHAAVRDILKNEVYIGHRVHGKIKRDCIGAPKTNREREEWIYVYNAHPAIVEEAVFQKVQEILANNSEKREKMRRRTTTKQSSRELLLHKLFCGDCGAVMSAMKRNQRITSSLEPKIFYQCNEYVYSGRTKCCNHYMSQEKLLAVLEKAVYTQVQVIGDLEKLGKMNLFCPDSRSALKNEQEIVNEIKRKLRTVEGKMETLFENYNLGILEQSEFVYIKGRYEKEKEMLEVQLQLAEKDLENGKQTLSRKHQWIDALSNFCSFGKVQDETDWNRAVIDSLVEKIFIYSDKSIEICFRFRNEYEQAVQLVGKEAISGEVVV